MSYSDSAKTCILFLRGPAERRRAYHVDQIGSEEWFGRVGRTGSAIGPLDPINVVKGVWTLGSTQRCEVERIFRGVLQHAAHSNRTGSAVGEAVLRTERD